MKSMFNQGDYGQIAPVYSVSAGLDYPGVGPEHAYLKDKGRAEYVPINDEEAVNAFEYLSRMEGIIPAIESAHAVAYAMKVAPQMDTDDVIITADDIYEKYKTLKLKKPLGKTQMRTCLAKLKKYHIIQNLDTDMGNSETRIQIYHSIALAVSAVSLDELYKASEMKLKTYTESGDNDENEEYDD